MNIFIVEDEYWALEEMKLLLMKYQTDHTLYFYDNGEDAFKEFPTHKPELIVTDITMPGMDGLELVEKVTDINPAIKCIILTVHDEFEYAKKGIQLGVVDYLLKPIKKEALYEIIDTTVEKIKQTKLEESDKQLWSINQLIFNQLGKNKESQEIFEQQSFYFIYLLFGNWQTPLEVDVDVQSYLVKMGAANDSWLLSLGEQRKLLLIPHENKVISFITELYRCMKEKEQVHLCYAVKEKNSGLIEAYQKVHQLMEQKKYFGDSTLIEEQQLESEKDVSELWTTVRVIEKQMRQGEYASIPEQLDYLINQIKQIKMTQKQLYRFLLDMYYAILYKLQQSTSQVLSIENFDEYFEELDSLVTFDQLRNWLEQLMRLLMNASAKEVVAPKHLIPKVKDLVAEFYSDNITFQEFADAHHVSLSYLSREFKEQTNMTFKEYLTSYRIKKAQELFKNGMERTTEVGTLVGYNDPKHFRTVFKKVTGLSPKEYKDRL